MDYNDASYMDHDGQHTNAVQVTVLSGEFSVTLSILQCRIGTEMITYTLVLDQTTSPVPSLTHSTTASSPGSITGNSEDSYDYFGGAMSAPNSEGSDEELTMTHARLVDRDRSMVVALAQEDQSTPISNSQRGSGISDSWQLLEYIPLLDRIMAEKRVAAEAEKKARWNGDYLLKLLENEGFNKELVEELQTVINMVRHLNIMLFKDKNDTNDWKIKPKVMEELEEVTIQVIHYFDEFGNSLNRGIDKIHEVKPHLPSLGPDTDPCVLRTALNVWNDRLMKELAPVREREKQLFEGLAEFYDAMIYHSFLQVRKTNPRHSMCKLTEEFSAIHEAIEFLNEAFATIDREMHRLGAMYQAAQERLLSMPEVYHNQYKGQVVHEFLEAQMKADAEDVTAALSTMTTVSGAAVNSSGVGTKTPNAALKDARMMTKEEEAEEDREFQAVIVHLQKLKLEQEAAKAKEAAEAKEAAKFKAAAKAEAAGKANAVVTKESKDKSETGSSSSSSQAIEKVKKENVQPKKKSSL